jgi:hypothetical protein
VLHDSKPDEESPIVERVVRVQRDSGDVEHRRDRALTTRPHGHVEVAGAICVRTRQDRLKPVVPSGIRELMAPQPDAGVVVRSARIRLPEIDASAADGAARTRQHVAAERDARAAGCRNDDLKCVPPICPGVTPKPLHVAAVAGDEAAAATHRATAKHAAATLGRRSGTGIIEAITLEPVPD